MEGLDGIVSGGIFAVEIFQDLRPHLGVPGSKRLRWKAGMRKAQPGSAARGLELNGDNGFGARRRTLWSAAPTGVGYT